MLSVDRLTISFGGNQPFTAVNSISFDLEQGKTLAIVGESGSGKSLSALAIMGLLPPAATVEGDIRLNSAGKDIQFTPSSLQKIRGKQIGMVFQEPMSALNPVISAGKQLQEAIAVHQNCTATQSRQLAIDWLHKVQLQDAQTLYDRYPHQLSGGQKQRIMIAMAMCNHPALLIADEPTTALDATVQQEIIHLMRYLQLEHNTAMIFITHDLSLAAGIADDVLVMHKGNAVEYGVASQVLTDPKHAYTAALLACKPSSDRKGTRLPVINELMKNSISLPKVLPGSLYSNKPDQVPLLTVQNLNVWFSGRKPLFGKALPAFRAVDDVSFSINRGEVMGLVGESGCGKSTVARCLVGLIPSSTGSIVFDGADLTKTPLQQWGSVRRKVQMIFQDPYASLNPRMTIGDMLMEPLRIYKIVHNNELPGEVARLLDLVQLPSGAAGKYPHQFSGGQRQRIGIARALALRPKLLICDESVSALDVSIQAQILNLLKDLQSEFRLTYLFISHDLSVIHYLSDRVMVMKTGRIVEQGDASQVLAHPSHEYTRKLVASVL